MDDLCVCQICGMRFVVEDKKESFVYIGDRIRDNRYCNGCWNNIVEAHSKPFNLRKYKGKR